MYCTVLYCTELYCTVLYLEAVDEDVGGGGEGQQQVAQLDQQAAPQRLVQQLAVQQHLASNISSAVVCESSLRI